MIRTLIVVALFMYAAAPGWSQEKRTLTPNDVFNLKTVSDPEISPEGTWVAYRVSGLDAKDDASIADLYMVSISGGEPVRLTHHADSERLPKWSPDGRYLAFLAKREGTKTQVWLLDRRGGEPAALTEYKASVSDLVWSPDSTRLALVVSDVDPDDPQNLPEGERASAEKKAAKPIVVRRLQFKRDGEGYLGDLRSHIHIFDIAKKTSIQLTSGPYDDERPRWSPDGTSIVFISNLYGQP